MNKHISFKAEFKRVLVLLGPYIFLGVVIIGALLSKGDWSKLESAMRLPFFYGFLTWLGLGLYVAARYKLSGGRDVPSGVYRGDDGDDYAPTVNTNGTPMGIGSHDIHGNPYGSGD